MLFSKKALTLGVLNCLEGLEYYMQNLAAFYLS